MRRSPAILEVLLGSLVALGIFASVLGYNMLPVLGLGALALLVLSQSPAVRSFRPRSAQAAVSSLARVEFADIGGQEMAKQELVEALDFIVERERMQGLGIRPLRGLLLAGPPGTGKTLLARAAATYTGSAFLSASGSEFVEMYAGVGAQRVRDLFRRSRELARGGQRKGAVIFIDEMEVLGGRRGSHSSHLEYDQTLNQLLVEMDGISGRDEVQILVIGATNRADMLDPALLRPGRFDRIVQVDLPDLPGRRAILQIHTRHRPLHPEISLDQIARETFGFSGAHLESLCNEAAINAFRDSGPVIEPRHIRDAIDKVILGEKMDRRPSPEERHRVAVHEAGHALVGEWVHPGSVSSVTVTPRGRAMGYVRSHLGEDRYIYTRDWLDGQIRICLAGAVAEELGLGQRSTGAQGDYEQAWDLARRIVRSGLSDLGMVDAAGGEAPGETTAASAILSAQEDAVRKYLEEHRAVLLQVAEHLSAHEALTGDELRLHLCAGVVH